MQLLILERTRYIRRLQGGSLHRESRCLFGGRGLGLRVDLRSVLIVSALLFDGRLFRVPDLLRTLGFTHALFHWAAHFLFLKSLLLFGQIFYLEKSFGVLVNS